VVTPPRRVKFDGCNRHGLLNNARMPLPRVKSSLFESLHGVQQSRLPDRTFERGTGCWNCIHAQSAADFWNQRRQAVLTKAMQISIESPKGGNDPAAKQLCSRVDQIDQAVQQRKLIRCTKGIVANGNPVGDLVADAFMCERWTGRDGSSLAKIEGKVDLLPDELRERIDGPDPIDPNKIKIIKSEDLS